MATMCSCLTEPNRKGNQQNVGCDELASSLGLGYWTNGYYFQVMNFYIVCSRALIKPKTLILELPLHSLGPN